MKKFRLAHFRPTHLLTAFVIQKVFGNYTYTIRHGLAAGMRRRGGLGFLPFSPVETAEVRFLRSLRLDGKVVYDIGAFEGVLTLLLSRRAKQVIAYEPNPQNFARSRENFRLNELKNVQIMNRGISDKPGEIYLSYDPLMPGAGSADSLIAGQINDSVKSARRITISVVPLDWDIAEHRLPAPALIKIDIEGLEFAALQGMRQTLTDHHPELFIEMHGATPQQKVENAAAVIAFLSNLGYRIHDVEQGDYLTPESLGVRRPGHVYCDFPDGPAGLN